MNQEAIRNDSSQPDTGHARSTLRSLAGVPAVGGDHLNAERFIVTYGERVRRSPELDLWFIWNGAWWEEDRLDRVRDMARDCIDQLREWVAEADSPWEFKRRSTHYTGSARAGRREALLSIVGAHPAVVVAIAQLDSHPMLLACKNGTVDLQTGELRRAQPEEYLTRGVPVDYDASAESALWEQFIETIFVSDSDLIAFVQRLPGIASPASSVSMFSPYFVARELTARAPSSELSKIYLVTMR